MASNEQQQSVQGASDHRATYASFTSFAKWGSIVVAVVLLGLYLFLV